MSKIKCKSSNAVEQFVMNMEAGIISGTFQKGMRLPPERELAEKMNLSKTVVNAGISELSAKGFVQVIPRQGTFVNDYVRNGNIEVLNSVISFHGGKFDQKTLNSLMELRFNVEGECAYLAARNRTAEDLQEMEEQYQKICKAATMEEMSQASFTFHLLVACASGNNIYPLMFNSFKEVLHTFSMTVFRAYGMEMVAPPIRRIIDAIRDQDPQRAKKEMQQMVANRNIELGEQYFCDESI